MGKPDGFLLYPRKLPEQFSPEERINNYKEIYKSFSNEEIQEQGARCMDCGVPFCHNACPLGNIIPDFNDAVYHRDWETAIEILSTTNNFPEFTGRICPAPCEGSCVLGINKPQVTIEYIEKMIVEKAFEYGMIKPKIPSKRTGKNVAIVGSGPAGLAAAAQLNAAGHTVTVYERESRIGGLLRYGIPDFKLEKWVIDRRMEVMEQEGIVFKTDANVGVNIEAEELVKNNDAVVLCGGSTIPRDLPIEGRDAKGIYFAMDFLTQQNKRVAGDDEPQHPITAQGKNVLVIGGGDTGSDCVGTSNRHGAKQVIQIELLSKPPDSREEDNPWPEWPMILRTSSSHDEGCERKWSILSEEFLKDAEGNVKALRVVEIEWYVKEDGSRAFRKIKGTEREIPCDVVFLAMGFLHPQKEGMLETLKIKTDARGNVDSTNYQTNKKKIFTAGDMRRGQSLVVWAISEGREAARAVDEYLMGFTQLETKDSEPIRASSFQ